MSDNVASSAADTAKATPSVTPTATAAGSTADEMLGPAQPGPPSGMTTEAAATAAAAPRVIDEHTDLSTLTDQEIMRLQEGMLNDEVTSRPLISTPVPLVSIREEYIAGSPTVLKKLDWLQEHGWDQVWRARGDGDCFYRSFTLAYLLRILHSRDRPAAAAATLKAIEQAMPAMKEVGFDADLYEMFLEPLLDLVNALKAPEETEWALVQALQDAEKSNCIVVVLRLITSAYMRTHADLFSPFLFSPTTFLPLAPDDFCRQEVEPVGKEADHAQIMALAEALGVRARVAYLDRSEVKTDGDVINWVEFGKPLAVGAAEGNEVLTLLYRPGHFDVVTQDPLVQRSS